MALPPTQIADQAGSRRRVSQRERGGRQEGDAVELGDQVSGGRLCRDPGRIGNGDFVKDAHACSLTKCPQCFPVS